uniref:Uncharacterized protein n=1 Tax=Rhipicephalus zambeziensis TaxID=60191 RepID=A0A224Y8E8_9ACAR
MSKPATTSEPKDTTPAPDAMTRQSGHSPLGKLSERSASLASKLCPILPKGTVLTPITSVPDTTIARTSNGVNVSGLLPSKSTAQVVPVKLWRNPYAAISDLAPVPVVHLDKSKPLPGSPLDQKEATSNWLAPQPANSEDSVCPAAVKNANTVLIVKNIQDGKAVIMAQPANSTTKELSCRIVSQQQSPSNAYKVSTTATGNTVKLVQIAAATTTTSNFARVSDSAPKITVAESVQANTARVLPRTFPTLKSVWCKTENQRNSPTASTAARPMKSILGKHSPAVVHIAPAEGSSTSKKILVLPPQLTTVPTKVSRYHVAPTAQSKSPDVVRPTNKQERDATAQSKPPDVARPSNKQGRDATDQSKPPYVARPLNKQKRVVIVQSKPPYVARHLNKQVRDATAQSKPPDVARLSCSDKQERVSGGGQKVKETHTTAELVFTPQKDEDGCGIKISSVVSLAGKQSLVFPAPVAPPESERGESIDSSDTKSSGKSSETTHSNEEDEETDSDTEVPQLSSSMLSVRANKIDGDVIELCSFQEKKGNSVIGSQIVFKPAPVAGNASQSICPSSKLDKLKEAIRILEEDSTLQECDMFTDREKEFLMSLLHRVDCSGQVPEDSKRDPKQCSSGPSTLSSTESRGKSPQSNVRIKTEPGTAAETLANEPDQKKAEHGTSGLSVADARKSQGSSVTIDSNVRIKREPGVSTDTPILEAYQRDPKEGSSGSGATGAYKVLHKSPHDPSTVCTKTKPESPPGSVPSAKKEDAASRDGSTSHKPLRRIVITSDEVPVISSDEVKNGLEAFLIRNNISNNFSKDEIIKLHWDGKDVNSFHFRDIDSEEVQQPLVATPKVVRPAILRCGKALTPAGHIGAEPLGTAAALISKQRVSEAVTANAENVVEELTIPTDGTVVPAGFKAVRLRCRTETGQMVERFVLKSLKPIRVISSTARPEKQIRFLPRAIRYVNETGEVIEKLVNAQQQIMQVVPSIPVVSKSTPVCTASLPSMSVLKPTYTKPAGLIKPSAVAASAVSAQLGKHFVSDVVTSSTISNLLAKQPEVIVSSSAPTVCPPGVTAPVTPSNVVIAKAPVALGLQSTPSVLPIGVASSKPTPPTASKPESSAGVDAERMFEPECLLEVSNNTLDVQSLKKKGLNDNSSSDSSSTSSSDAGDYVPPVVKRKEERKPTVSKRSPQKRSTVMREYRTRKRRQRKKQDRTVAMPSSSDKCQASRKRDGVNMAMRSSNCIDRPCVVTMYHLNDCLLSNGSVNLASVRREDLFVSASSPVVRLSPEKVVSVVELKPQTSDSPKQTVEGDSTKQTVEVSGVTDTNNVERLLREQQNELVQLRRKYKKQSS